MCRKLEKELKSTWNELKELNKELYSIQNAVSLKHDQYKKLIKYQASDSNITSKKINEIYCAHITCHAGGEEDMEGNSIQIDYLGYDLAEELSKNMNTPKYILEEIVENEFYSSDITTNAVYTLAKQSLLIAEDKHSTTKELSDIYWHLDDTYKALSQHPNASTKILDNLVKHIDINVYINIANHSNVTPKVLNKISCIFEEVDNLILEHSKTSTRTKKKIAKKGKNHD